MNGWPNRYPLKYLAKHQSSLLQIEALLFGQAGFLTLNHSEDKYFNELKNEYIFLKNKFQLNPLENHLWKFMRLRPPNFPTIRISQFAVLISKSKSLVFKNPKFRKPGGNKTIFRS